MVARFLATMNTYIPKMYKVSKYNYAIEHNSKIVLFNGLSGYGFCMSEKEWEQLSSFFKALDSFSTQYPDDFKRIKDMGFIVEDDFDEVAYVKYKNKEACFANRDYMLIINPTLECCFKCWYCYEEHLTGHMSEETMSALKKHISMQVGNGSITSLQLSWFGGEPLLFFDKIVYPVSLFAQDKCDKKGIPFNNGITTNAYCINNMVVEKMNEIKLKNFQITLDGNRERHNKIRNHNGEPSYDKIIENINLLCAGIKDVEINLRINYDDVTLNMNPEDVLLSFPKEYRKNIIIDLHRVWQTTNSEQAKLFSNGGNAKLNEFMEKASSLGYQCHSGGRIELGTFCSCYANRKNYACINWDGNIFKCTARSFNEENSVGKLQEDGQIVWYEKKISRLYGYSPLEHPTCEQCEYLPICMGQCPQNYMESEHTMECVYEKKERNINDRIIDLYKSSLKKKNA